MQVRQNILGHPQAERDGAMLDKAFFEWVGYRTLVEGCDRAVVVGRRGTGKSAIVHQLRKHLADAERRCVLALCAEEDQVIGLREWVGLFGDKFSYIRAGSRLAWRWGLLMEMASYLAGHYKVKGSKYEGALLRHTKGWKVGRGGTTSRLRAALAGIPRGNETPGEFVGGLAERLRIGEVEAAVADVLEGVGLKMAVLVDRLDEGYDPDPVGVGLVAGAVYATLDINRMERVSGTVFLRDNIWKSIQLLDADYSRNLEGNVWPLHWSEFDLLNMLCKRLRVAFGCDDEQNLDVWNKCAGDSLQGDAGFARCLRLTLYRPRDLLILMNDAFGLAAGEGRRSVEIEDLDRVAQEISRTRLEDLVKEYESVMAGLRGYVGAFANGEAHLTVEEACAAVDRAKERIESLGAAAVQELRILGDSESVVRMLYEIGFVGVKHPVIGVYGFCHDGKSEKQEWKGSSELLVHPCYWRGLGLRGAEMGMKEAEQIYDEYKVETVSEVAGLRTRRLGQLIAKLGKIPMGEPGWGEFEEWCAEAIGVCFAGSLVNVELHGNGVAVQRRDVLASNVAEKGVWRRIRDDYGVRQVVFEIKNKELAEPDDFRQVVTYGEGQYGRLSFIVTRGKKWEIEKGNMLDWVREIYHTQKRLLVVLPAGTLAGMLSKLRTLGKHDAPGMLLGKILDTYERRYVSLPSSQGRASRG